nr:MAG TPA: hypothetical protein [Caudoviricetes sp.]
MVFSFSCPQNRKNQKEDYRPNSGYNIFLHSFVVNGFFRFPLRCLPRPHCFLLLFVSPVPVKLPPCVVSEPLSSCHKTVPLRNVNSPLDLSCNRVIL